MTDPKPYDLPRVLVVCNSTALRRAFGELLYEMLVEPHWHLQIGGVAEYAAWCRPHVIVLALRDTADNLTAYEALTAAYGDSAAVRVGLASLLLCHCRQRRRAWPAPRAIRAGRSLRCSLPRFRTSRTLSVKVRRRRAWITAVRAVAGAGRVRCAVRARLRPRSVRAACGRRD